MKLYVVRNKEGKFFRPVGYGGYGQSWQDKLEKAKFYSKAGTAKGRASFWFGAYPKYGCPEILEFELDVAAAKVLNVEVETAKNIEKRRLQEEKRQKERDEYYKAQAIKQAEETFKKYGRK